MHENAVYFALQAELWRNFPEWRDTDEGRKKTEVLIIDLMRVIKEAGLDYVNLSERALINANKP